MFVAVLISAPGARGLAPDLVENLRSAWGGGPVRWLAAREAAEFALPARPDTFDTARDDLNRMGVDLAIVPAVGRAKKLLIADMDSTMIGQECIDELAEVAGVGAQVRDVTARAMNGELDFEAALNARLSLMRGLPETVIGDVLAQRITLAAGGPVLLATMKAAGGFCALVSGGFTAFTGPIANALGFDVHRANVLGIRDGALSGGVDGPILGQAAKVAALQEYCAQLGIAEVDAIAVGDGANDLPMLLRAGMGVALHAKPAVAAQSDIRINHGDLTALLYLQGVEEKDFVQISAPSLGA